MHFSTDRNSAGKDVGGGHAPYPSSQRSLLESSVHSLAGTVLEMFDVLTFEPLRNLRLGLS